MNGVYRNKCDGSYLNVLHLAKLVCPQMFYGQWMGLPPGGLNL